VSASTGPLPSGGVATSLGSDPITFEPRDFAPGHGGGGTDLARALPPAGNCRQATKGTGRRLARRLSRKPAPDALLDVSDREAINTRSKRTLVARDPGERRNQRRRVTQEVNRSSKRRPGLGRRQTVKLGLHLRYPPGAGAIGLGRRLPTDSPAPGRHTHRCLVPRLGICGDPVGRGPVAHPAVGRTQEAASWAKTDTMGR